MDDYQQRVFQEHDDLTTKLEALRVFLSSKTCANLCKNEQSRLMRQEDLMLRYLIVLEERMNHFGVNT